MEALGAVRGTPSVTAHWHPPFLSSAVPLGTLGHRRSGPGVETPGYSRRSLRDRSSPWELVSFVPEGRLTVARRFNAGWPGRVGASAEGTADGSPRNRQGNTFCNGALASTLFEISRPSRDFRSSAKRTRR